MLWYLNEYFHLCIAILGLSSIGRSIVFIPQDTEEVEISRILEEQQCEVLLIRHSNISKLEDALNTGYYKNLHTVIYTNEDLIEKMEVGYNSRAEETLMQEYNIDVLSLSHLICTEYTKYGTIFGIPIIDRSTSHFGIRSIFNS